AESLPSKRHGDYLFETPGAAWHAVARLLPGRKTRFAAVAVDDPGRRLAVSEVVLPAGFLATHPCRRLVSASLQLSDDWKGRLFIGQPGIGIHREQNARFAMYLAKQVAPAVYTQYLVGRVRTRAEAIERSRIARELHDGVTQSLLGLEMELVVLHRRAVVEA